MGLISAGLNALGGTLASQWREYFYCDAMPADVLATKAMKRINGRFGGSKTEDDNVISDGSIIVVNDGQCMIIVDQGKIVDFCAEPGEYKFELNGEPTLLYGDFNGEKVMEILKTTFDRFSFGIDYLMECLHALQTAKGDLLTVSLELGSRMLVASGIAADVEEGKAKMLAALESGAGLAKLKEMIAAQGGDSRVCDEIAYLPHAAYKISVPAPQDGYVAKMNTTAIGYCAQSLGAGRQKKTDVIDPAVGLVMDVRLGDYVKAGDSLATLYLNKRELANDAIVRMQQAITITQEKPELPPLVYAAVSRDGVVR